MTILSIIAELLGADDVAQGLRKISGGLGEVDKSGEKAASGAKLLTEGVESIGLGIARATLGVAAFTFSIEKLGEIISESITNFANLEKLNLRLDAVFRATGAGARINQASIKDLSEEMSRTTFVTNNAVLQAASSLATFQSIGQESFTNVIKLAADLSTVLGQDFQSVVIQLGRGLDGLAHGSVDGLYRVFRVLSPAIRDNIEALAKSGQTVEAQRVLFEELNKAVGGAAAGEHTGLAGSIDSQKKLWEDFTVALGRWIETATKIPAIMDLIQKAGRGTVNLMNQATDVLQGVGPSPQQQLQSQIQSLEAERQAAIDKLGTMTGMFGRFMFSDETVANQKETVHQLEEALARVERLSEVLGIAAMNADRMRQAVSDTKPPISAADFFKVLEGTQVAVGAAGNALTSRQAQAQAQRDDAHTKLRMLQDSLKLTGTETSPEKLADATKAVKEADQAYQDTLESIASNARAHAGLSLRIREEQADLRELIAVQNESRHNQAVEVQLLQYINEERSKGHAITAQLTAQLRAEADATVKLNEEKAGGEITRNQNEQISNLQRLLDAQKESNYARKVANEEIQLENTYLSKQIDITPELAAHIHELAVQTVALNAATDKAVDSQKNSKQITDLNRLMGALQESIKARDIMQEQIRLESDEMDRTGKVTDQARAAFHLQATELVNLQDKYKKLDQFQQAQIAGTEMFVNTVQEAFGGLATAITDSFSQGGNAGDRFKHVLQDILNSMIKLVVQLGVINPLMNMLFKNMQGFQKSPELFDLFGSGSGSGSSGQGGLGSIISAGISIIGSIFRGMSGGGGTFPGIPSGFKMATGGSGIVRRPTLFLAGEAGDEQFDFRPIGSPGAGGRMHVSIDARGADRVGLRRVERRLAQLNATFERRSISASINAIRRGGDASEALRS